MKYKLLLLSFLSVLLVAYMGGILTDTGEWYESIKPSITPPGYVFPIAWNIIFFLIFISFYLILVKRNDKRTITAYTINFVLNVLWSFFFFYLKNPKIAFFELILLEASIVWMIVESWKVDKKAALLLVPYALWVLFAGFLNFLIAFNIAI